MNNVSIASSIDIALPTPTGNGSDKVAQRVALTSDPKAIQVALSAMAPQPALPQNATELLMYAVEKDHSLLVLFAVLLGADINASDRKGFTPLTAAAMDNNCAMVQLLHDLEADIDAADATGATPLTTAVESGRLDMVRILCNLGGELSGRNAEGATAVTAAAASKNLEMVRLLKECGADLDESDGTGRNAATLAVETNNQELLEFLHDSGANLSDPDANGTTPATTAILTNNLNMLDVLSNLSVDFYVENEDGTTACTTAVFENNLDVMIFFEEIAYDFDAQDGNCDSPLSICYDNDFKEMAKVLVQLGASTNVTNKYHDLLLAEAIWDDAQEWVDLFEQLGADKKLYEEWLLRKELAHAWGIGGESVIKRENEEELSFNLPFFHCFAAKEMAIECLNRFLKDDPTFSMNEKDFLSKAVRALITPADEIPAEQIAEQSKYQPILLMAGPEYHTIVFGVYLGQVFLCNRGDGKREDGIVFFKPCEITPELIETLRADYSDMKELDAALAGLRLIPEEGIKMSWQKTDTCCWASVKAAIGALLKLQGKGHDCYKCFTAFSRKFFLEKYIQKSQNPTLFLLQQIADKLMLKDAKKPHYSLSIGFVEIFAKIQELSK